MVELEDEEFKPRRQESQESVPLYPQHPFKFKCVAKPWNSLISSPQFAEAHLKRTIENGKRRVLLTGSSIDFEAYGDENDINDLRVDFNYPMGKTPISISNIVRSCDGLACLLTDADSLILWNPSTREARELPRGRNFRRFYFFYGVGYDHSTNDYKVARVVRDFPSECYEEMIVEVFALKNNTWRMGKVLNPHLPFSRAMKGTYVNGALHWLVYINNVNERYKICSFNLAEEKFEDMLQLPDCFNQDIDWPGLGVSSNHFFAYGIRV